MKSYIESTLQAEYILKKCESPKRIILVVHGYLENGERVLSSLEDYLPEDAIVLAPNAPFPVPFEKRGKKRLGFAWYFFDRDEKKYLFNYDVPANFLCNLISELNLPDLPVTFIGHSQGGYIAPFFVEKFKGTIERFIGIGCEVRHTFLSREIDYKVDLIHGDMDIIVNPTHAKESVEKISNGTFHLLEDEGHRVSTAMAKKVQEILSN